MTVVNRLLDSPHYGEHWGRHWLDVVRYADTAGETADYPVPVAWRYRNYVIDAFNSDKPFDRFIVEQLAGDECWPDDPGAVVATGFAENNFALQLNALQSTTRDLAIPGVARIDADAPPAADQPSGTRSYDPDAAFDPRSSSYRPPENIGPKPQPQVRRTGPRRAGIRSRICLIPRRRWRT